MNNYLRFVTNLEDEDFTDGWALTRVSKGSEQGQIEFYSQQHDLKFSIPNNPYTSYQTKVIQFDVPSSFIEEHEQEIIAGIKPTLLALLDVNVLKYFDLIPLNLVVDKEFYNQCILKSISILREIKTIDGIKELTYKTQEKSNLLRIDERKCPKSQPRTLED